MNPEPFKILVFVGHRFQAVSSELCRRRAAESLKYFSCCAKTQRNRAGIHWLMSSPSKCSETPKNCPESRLSYEEEERGREQEHLLFEKEPIKHSSVHSSTSEAPLTLRCPSEQVRGHMRITSWSSQGENKAGCMQES